MIVMLENEVGLTASFDVDLQHVPIYLLRRGRLFARGESMGGLPHYRALAIIDISDAKPITHQPEETADVEA